MGRNRYGVWLKKRREEVGLTQQELADKVHVSRTYIAHIETGRRVPSEEDARRLDQALSAHGALTDFRPQDEGEVEEYFAPVLELERQAVQIWEYAEGFFPGLLQTERYAHALFGRAFPPITEEERYKRVVTRLDRAKILGNPTTPVLWALLDEGLLRRPMAPVDIMAEQITHVADLAESERIRVHVLPFGAGYNPLMGGALTLMWFQDQPPMAYTEGHAMGRTHDSPAVVQRYQHRYDLALSDALPLKESVAMLRATVKEYEHRD
ncbi:helix-turn-helix domain-containing protein [Streptomyces acidiscabies]|uniref:helix-turn-helix domain-containing protein n=1 Tax=Streptomyces acidiscabies TaxID=42234 RepID=UPI000950C902|nr:helix-turn-helix transcriptional regulator [Streptomyces acidiscabies]